MPPDLFREFSLRYLAQIAQMLKSDNVARDVPLILFSKGANSHLEALADTGCAALGLDWTISLGDARARVGDRVALQGNRRSGRAARQPGSDPRRSGNCAATASARIRAMCSISATALRRR